jgi:2-polyprenyl-6-methoxyphenol hydroxylase-like FAD-dependent oxidoreductase
MSKVIVVGAGFSGSAAALMLTTAGHDVIVIDRDAGPVPDGPDEAWNWDRRSIRQYRFAHGLLPRGHALMSRYFPQLVEQLRERGGLELNLAHSFVDLVPGSSHRPDDDRFATVTARRPTFDWLWATALAEEPAIAVRRGVPVVGLLRGADVEPGVPHVAGVRLEDGTELRADLVVDAGGRGSPVVDLLARIGARQPATDEHDSGFAYTGRYYRSRDGELPRLRAPIVTPMGSISLLTLPADRATWAVTVYTRADDRALRPLRRPEVFDRLLRACPLHAHWIEGEPIRDVASISGVANRVRRFVVDGVPVATGLVALGDAQQCTDPSLGRGMTMGLMHTEVLCDVLREHDAGSAALALAFDAATDSVVGPWYEATVQNGQLRLAEMGAAARGERFAPEGPPAIAMALTRATSVDEDAARWFAELLSCLTTAQELFSRPGVVARVMELDGHTPRRAIAGPDRAELLELVAA